MVSYYVLCFVLYTTIAVCCVPLRCSERQCALVRTLCERQGKRPLLVWCCTRRGRERWRLFCALGLFTPIMPCHRCPLLLLGLLFSSCKFICYIPSILIVLRSCRVFLQARKEMVTLLSDVIRSRRAEQASGTATVEKTDLLQVSPPDTRHKTYAPRMPPPEWQMLREEGREGCVESRTRYRRQHVSD